MNPAICPYCEQKSYTSSPETMAKCSFCGKLFAEAQTPHQTLVILDRSLPDAEAMAQEFTAKWRDRGEPRKAIVDRRQRRVRVEYVGAERRNYPVGAAYSPDPRARPSVTDY